MAHQYVSPTIYMDGFDITPQFREHSLTVSVDALDDTVFGDTTRSNQAGLVSAAFEMSGFWTGGANSIDDVLAARLGVNTDVLLSMVPIQGAADGSLAYAMNGRVTRYNPFDGDVSTLHAIAMRVDHATNADGLIRGTVMATGAKTSTGNGTARQLGAVAAGQSVYAGLHVTAASGTSPTLDMIVESDDNSGMTTATTRLTFTQKTAVGFQGLISAAGAITDDWWRASWTIGGGSPSFTVVVVIGIK